MARDACTVPVSWHSLKELELQPLRKVCPLHCVYFLCGQVKWWMAAGWDGRMDCERSEVSERGGRMEGRGEQEDYAGLQRIVKQ